MKKIICAFVGAFLLALAVLLIIDNFDIFSVISIAIFWIIFVGIGLLTSSSYKSANIQKMKKAIAWLSIATVIGLAYPSMLNPYFMVPVAIVLLSLIFYRGNRAFFGMSFLLSFIGFISFVYVFLETPVTLFETTALGYFVWVSVVMIFNSLFSIVTYMMKTYKEFAMPLKKSKEKSYVLNPPASWFVLPIVFLLLASLGAYASISPDVDKGATGSWMLPLYTILMLALVFAAGKSLNRVSIDKSSITVKGILFPRKLKIETNEIKSAVTRTMPIGYGYNTVLLEVYTKKGVKRIDIRTNYNYRDTIQFMQVAKGILGKRFKKAQ